MRNWMILSMLGISLVSCEAPTGGYGKVQEYDHPQAPIANAKVILLVGDEKVDSTTTDDQGNFRISMRVGGILFGAPNDRFLVEKDGFVPVEYKLRERDKADPKFDREHIQILLHKD